VNRVRPAVASPRRPDVAGSIDGVEENYGETLFIALGSVS